MHARILSFLVWALLAASVAYWALTLGARSPQAPGTARPGAPSVGTGDWARLFVSTGPAAVAVEDAGSRFQLLGVVAPRAQDRQADEGVALIAVAGAPARAFRLGQVVDGELKLLSVSRREVGLGTGSVVTLRLALPAAAGETVSMAPQTLPPLPPPVMAPDLNPPAGMVPPTQVAPQPLPPMPPVTEPGREQSR